MLDKLPYEIISMITGYLSTYDIVHLFMVNKELYSYYKMDNSVFFPMTKIVDLPLILRYFGENKELITIEDFLKYKGHTVIKFSLKYPFLYNKIKYIDYNNNVSFSYRFPFLDKCQPFVIDSNLTQFYNLKKILNTTLAVIHHDDINDVIDFDTLNYCACGEMKSFRSLIIHSNYTDTKYEKSNLNINPLTIEHLEFNVKLFNKVDFASMIKLKKLIIHDDPDRHQNTSFHDDPDRHQNTSFHDDENVNNYFLPDSLEEFSLYNGMYVIPHNIKKLSMKITTTPSISLEPIRLQFLTIFIKTDQFNIVNENVESVSIIIDTSINDVSTLFFPNAKNINIRIKIDHIGNLLKFVADFLSQYHELNNLVIEKKWNNKSDFIIDLPVLKVNHCDIQSAIKCLFFNYYNYIPYVSNNDAYDLNNIQITSFGYYYFNKCSIDISYHFNFPNLKYLKLTLFMEDDDQNSDDDSDDEANISKNELLMRNCNKIFTNKKIHTIHIAGSNCFNLSSFECHTFIFDCDPCTYGRYCESINPSPKLMFPPKNYEHLIVKNGSLQLPLINENLKKITLYYNRYAPMNRMNVMVNKINLMNVKELHVTKEDQLDRLIYKKSCRILIDIPETLCWFS